MVRSKIVLVQLVACMVMHTERDQHVKIILHFNETSGISET